MVSRAGELLLGGSATRREPFRGLSLRTEVLVSLGLLVVCAIALNAALLIKLWERDLIARRLEGLSALGAAAQVAVEASLPAPNQPLEELLPALAPEWAGLAVHEATGEMRARSGPWVPGAEPAAIREALGREAPVTHFSGTGRLFFSRWGQNIEFLLPLRVDGRTVGVVRAVSPLTGLRDSLWGYGPLIVLFILLDGLLIALFGSWLLRRRVVGPVERLAGAAASYRLGEPPPELAGIQGAAEIVSLARSLEAMLAGLERAAAEREDYVQRLEEAMRLLRSAQEELVRSEKLAVVGQLAAGVAHEIGNPLASLLGYTELLASRSLPPEEAADGLRRMRQEVGRIDAIVRGLLDFARPQPTDITELDVNAALTEAAGLLSHRQGVRQAIEVETRLAEGLPPVRADRGQLVQVLLNLMLNAVDAMPEGGTLRLATGEVEPGPEEMAALFGRARRQDDPPGSDFSHLRGQPRAAAPPARSRFVALSVADTGRGIACEQMGRLFDPFYTTKPPGAGTGLGLAISLRLVRSFGGAIRVQSRAGEGSCFEVLLPAARGAAHGD